MTSDGYIPWLYHRLGKWGLKGVVILVTWQLEIREPRTQGTMRSGRLAIWISMRQGGKETGALGAKVPWKQFPGEPGYVGIEESIQ